MIYYLFPLPFFISLNTQGPVRLKCLMKKAHQEMITWLRYKLGCVGHEQRLVNENNFCS